MLAGVTYLVSVIAAVTVTPLVFLWQQSSNFARHGVGSLIISSKWGIKNGNELIESVWERVWSDGGQECIAARFWAQGVFGEEQDEVFAAVLFTCGGNCVELLQLVVAFQPCRRISSLLASMHQLCSTRYSWSCCSLLPAASQGTSTPPHPLHSCEIVQDCVFLGQSLTVLCYSKSRKE